jgi:hypothetical protein
MLPKKLFLFFTLLFFCLWGKNIHAQNKAITQILVQKQDSSWGTNVAQALLNHLYLQLRLGKIQGYTDVSCSQKIQTSDIPLIEKYYHRRMDSADGVFLYEQWDFEKDSIRIIQGGISIILKKEEIVSEKKGKLKTETKNIELIYFPYAQLQNDLSTSVIPSNMNGNCDIHFDEWIQKRGFSGEIIYFAGRFFNEIQGIEFENKLKTKFHLTENNSMEASQKMQHFLYANHAIFDPVGKNISDLISQFFTEKPEEYFNTFPNSNHDFINFEFPEIEQLVVRRKIIWKSDNLLSEPMDIILLYRNGIQPDTLSFQNLFKFNLKMELLPLATYLATSSKERLFQINTTPVPRAIAPLMYDLLENPKNNTIWNQLLQKQKEYEAFLN